jgi:hypothetical protein
LLQSLHIPLGSFLKVIWLVYIGPATAYTLTLLYMSSQNSGYSEEVFTFQVFKFPIEQVQIWFIRLCISIRLSHPYSKGVSTFLKLFISYCPSLCSSIQSQLEGETKAPDVCRQLAIRRKYRSGIQCPLRTTHIYKAKQEPLSKERPFLSLPDQ